MKRQRARELPPDTPERISGVAQATARREGAGAATSLASAQPAREPPSPDGATEPEVERLHVALGVLQGQNNTLRQLVAIHDRLGALILQGTDVATITRLLGDLIGRRVLLLDMLLRPVAAAGGPRSESGDPARGWAPTEAYVVRVLQTLADDRRPLRVPPVAGFGVDVGCVMAPIVVGDAILGYLAILEVEPLDSAEEADSELNVLVVQHAATVYALAMMRERMASEVTRQLRDELLEGLLLGHIADPEEARRRAMHVGFVPGIAYDVLVLSAEDTALAASGDAAESPRAVARRRRLLDGLEELVASRTRGAITSARRNELVVIVPASDDPGQDLEALGRAAIHHATVLYSSWVLTVGIGGRCQEPAEISRSYEQARRAVEAARRFGRRGEVLAFENLGVYRLLFQVSDPAELHGFVEQVLGKLIAYDRRHQAGYVQTLSAYLESNASLQATARELSLHVNTVSYRLRRIQSLSGLDLEQADDRLLVQIALKILAGTEPVPRA